MGAAAAIAAVDRSGTPFLLPSVTAPVVVKDRTESRLFVLVSTPQLLFSLS